jgi:hypothetical protein
MYVSPYVVMYILHYYRTWWKQGGLLPFDLRVSYPLSVLLTVFSLISNATQTLSNIAVYDKVKVKLCLCFFFNCAPHHEGVLEEWKYNSTHS